MNWIPVTERLPEPGVAVLLTDGKSILVGERADAAYRAERGEKPWRWIACGVEGYEWEWDFDDFHTPDPVTHWMPLPPPPGELVTVYEYFDKQGRHGVGLSVAEAYEDGTGKPFQPKMDGGQHEP